MIVLGVWLFLSLKCYSFKLEAERTGFLSLIVRKGPVAGQFQDYQMIR